MGKQWKQCQTILGGSKITADGVFSHEIKSHLLFGGKVMTNLDSILKSRDITLPTKVHLVKAMVFPVVMYGCESWTIKKAEHWRIDDFELWCWRRLFARPLDYKEIQPVHPKGDQSWVLFGRTDVEAEAPILWPPDAKSWLIWKDPDARKDWRQEEKGTTEDEMVGWHHWLDEHGFGWTLRVGGQGGLACCDSWGHKESDTTELLNWTLAKKGDLNSSHPLLSPLWVPKSILYVCISFPAKWGDICIHIADSLHCTAEAKTIL